MDNISWNPGNTVGVVAPDPSKAMVVFFTAPKHIPAMSQAEGRAVYENRDYVRVQQPGERDAVTKEATVIDRQRWPEQWKAYQAGKQADPVGTLVDVLFPANPAIVMQLKALGVLTVEQLADMSDSASGNMPFGGDLKAKAKAYMETVVKAQGFNKLEAEIEHEKAKSSSLEMQLKDMQAQIHQLSLDRERAESTLPASELSPAMIEQIRAIVQSAPPKRGPGRPPKDDTN